MLRKLAAIFVLCLVTGALFGTLGALTARHSIRRSPAPSADPPAYPAEAPCKSGEATVTELPSGKRSCVPVTRFRVPPDPAPFDGRDHPLQT